MNIPISILTVPQTTTVELVTPNNIIVSDNTTDMYSVVLSSPTFNFVNELGEKNTQTFSVQIKNKTVNANLKVVIEIPMLVLGEEAVLILPLKEHTFSFKLNTNKQSNIDLIKGTISLEDITLKIFPIDGTGLIYVQLV